MFTRDRITGAMDIIAATGDGLGLLRAYEASPPAVATPAYRKRSGLIKTPPQKPLSDNPCSKPSVDRNQNELIHKDQKGIALCGVDLNRPLTAYRAHGGRRSHAAAGNP